MEKNNIIVIDSFLVIYTSNENNNYHVTIYQDKQIVFEGTTKEQPNKNIHILSTIDDMKILDGVFTNLICKKLKFDIVYRSINLKKYFDVTINGIIVNNSLKGIITLDNGIVIDGILRNIEDLFKLKINKNKTKVTFDTNNIFKCNFRGKYIDQDKSEYIGKFNSEGMLVEGVSIEKKGKCEGTFENWLLVEGTYIDSKDGTVQCGKFDKKCVLVEGIWTNSKGIIKQGTFNKKCELIKGKLFKEDGSIEEGEFDKKKRLHCLKGKIISADGIVREGKFIDGVYKQ